jgi:hypothetical protein
MHSAPTSGTLDQLPTALELLTAKAPPPIGSGVDSRPGFWDRACPPNASANLRPDRVASMSGFRLSASNAHRWGEDLGSPAPSSFLSPRFRQVASGVV